MPRAEIAGVRIELSEARVPAAERARILADPVFGESFSDHMVTMVYRHGRWGELRLQPFADLSLSPATLALHYGQSIFEALKAYRMANGDVGLFRVDSNAHRMNVSAKRIAMPPLPDGAFELACALISEADRDWVPSQDGAALYLRPFMFASEPHLSVRPGREYTFAVIASPVASYFGGHLRAITVLVESDHVRASGGGTGAVKFAGNYAAGFAAHGRAGAAGHDQVLWLDAGERRWVEELNAMNVMFVWRREGRTVLSTPPLGGTILPGVTRESLLTMARGANNQPVGDAREGGTMSRIDQVVEEATSIDDIVRGCADGSLLEMFACGTAAVIAPIGRLVLGGEPMDIGDGQPGQVTIGIRRDLLDLQYGRRPDPYGWLTSSASVLSDNGVEGLGPSTATSESGPPATPGSSGSST